MFLLVHFSQFSYPRRETVGVPSTVSPGRYLFQKMHRRTTLERQRRGFERRLSLSVFFFLSLLFALRRSEKIRLQMFDYDVIEALSRELRESLYSQTEQSSRKRERMVLRLLKTSFSSSSSSSLRCCCCCCSPLFDDIKA